MSHPIQNKKIGLIAGSGRFPMMMARAARNQGHRVIAAGIRGDTSLLLKPFVDELAWFRAGELTGLFAFFSRQGVHEVMMAGQVNPNHLFDPAVRMDEEFQELFAALKDRRADTIFSAVADKLQQHGMALMDSTLLLKKYMAPAGTLTRRGPTQEELEDITFGTRIAKAMGALDVGQTVVVKQKAIVAIEAMEGTDRCILRGGRIARGGAVVIKMSKPEQDPRFDVPVIGPRTLKSMIRFRAGCLAVEAGKTLVVDREQCVKLADRHGICIVSARAGVGSAVSE